MNSYSTSPLKLALRVMRSFGSAFLAPALLLSLAATPASATTYFFYDGNDAGINLTTWQLRNKGKFHHLSSGHDPGTLGLDTPWISPYHRATTNSKALGFRFTTSSPAANVQKLMYRIMEYESPNTCRLDTPNTRFISFGVMFPANAYDLTGKKGSNMIVQAHQGSGYPPFAIRTDETDGRLRLYCTMQNNDSKGSSNAFSSEAYLKDIRGHQIVFQKDRWYSIIIQLRFDPSMDAKGRVVVWVNQPCSSTFRAVNWSGRIGYTANVDGKTAGAGILVGQYQPRAEGTHVVLLDCIKFCDTAEEAAPY